MTVLRRMVFAFFSAYWGAALVLGGLVFVGFGFMQLQSDHRAERRAFLTMAATQQIAMLDAALAAAADSAVMLGSSVGAGETFDQATFNQVLKSRHASIVGLGWVPRVLEGERAAFERDATQALGAPFQIMDRDISGRFVPAVGREYYWPLLYTDLSMVTNMRVGLDLTGLKERFDQAFETIDREPHVILTRRLRMANSPPDAFCVFLLIPVFQQTGDKTSPPLKGVLIALIDIHGLVETSLGALKGDTRLLPLIQDQTAEPGKQILYLDTRSSQQTGLVLAEKTTELGGRSWRIAIETDPVIVGGGEGDPWVILGFVLCAGGLGVLLFYRHGAQFGRQVLGRTADSTASAACRDIDRARLQDFSALSTDLFWQSDASHRIAMIYPTASDDDFDPQQMVGQRLCHDARDPSGHDERLRLLDRHAPLTDYILSCPTDRGLRLFACRAKPMVDVDGGFVGYRGVARDVTDKTERMAHDVRLEQAFFAAMAWQQAMVTGVSQQIKHRVNQLAGLLSSPVPHDDAPLVARSVRHLLGKISQSLQNLSDCQLLASGRLHLVAAPFHLEAVMADLLSMLADDAKAKNVTIKAQIPPYMLPWLSGDEKRVRQIVYTLLSNAIDHSEGSDITVTVATADRSDGRIDVGLSVRDHGTGFTPADYERITALLAKPAMDPMIDDAGYIMSAEGGTLGLALCRDLCALMDGGLGLDNHPGQGATVRARLVFDRASPPAAIVRHRLARVPMNTEQIRILLAEDNAINQIITQDLLLEAGYAVLTATNGQEVLDILSRERVDMILMDIQMPVMDGLTATRYIRALTGGIADIPIIAMTADLHIQDNAEGKRAGMNDCLMKPVTLEALRRVIARYTHPVDQPVNAPNP